MIEQGISVEPTSPPTMAVRWTMQSERGTETLATLALNAASFEGHRVDVIGVVRQRGQLVPACTVGQTTRSTHGMPDVPRLPSDFFPMVIVTVLRGTVVINHAMIRPWGVL